jgi:hypothetical protein
MNNIFSILIYYIWLLILVSINADESVKCPANSATGLIGPEHCICNPGYTKYLLEDNKNFDVNFSCRKCDAGSYCPGSSGNGEKFTCPDNTYSAPGRNQCEQCKDNSYSAHGAATCLCNDGYYNIGKRDGKFLNCQLCLEGSYCRGGLDKIKKCPTNTFSPPGASTCTHCPPDSFSTEGSSTCKCNPSYYRKSYTLINEINNNANFMCLQCNSGNYCPGDELEYPCNEYGTSSIGSSKCSCQSGFVEETRSSDSLLGIDYDVRSKHAIKCRLCSAGSYCPGNEYEYICPFNTYSVVGKSSCSHCPLNGVSNPGATTCICGESSYSNLGSGESLICSKCIDGEIIQRNGLCGSCPDNTYLDNQKCNDCPNNSVSISNRQISCECKLSYAQTGFSSSLTCTPCNPGTFIKKSSVSTDSYCTLCPVNTYSGESDFICRECSTNSFSKIGSVKCKCQAGFYESISSITNEMTCELCEAGSYSNVGSSHCLICPINTYSSAGDNTCYSCPLHSYSKFSSATCTCNPGYANIGFGSSLSCSICNAGTYASYIGLSNEISTCLSCKPGTFSNINGSTECELCPDDTFSNENAIKCTSCPEGTTSHSGFSSCFPVPISGLWRGGSGNTPISQPTLNSPSSIGKKPILNSPNHISSIYPQVKKSNPQPINKNEQGGQYHLHQPINSLSAKKSSTYEPVLETEYNKPSSKHAEKPIPVPPSHVSTPTYIIDSDLNVFQKIKKIIKSKKFVIIGILTITMIIIIFLIFLAYQYFSGNNQNKNKRIYNDKCDSGNIKLKVRPILSSYKRENLTSKLSLERGRSEDTISPLNKHVDSNLHHHQTSLIQRHGKKVSKLQQELRKYDNYTSGNEDDDEITNLDDNNNYFDNSINLDNNIDNNNYIDNNICHSNLSNHSKLSDISTESDNDFPNDSSSDSTSIPIQNCSNNNIVTWQQNQRNSSFVRSVPVIAVKDYRSNKSASSDSDNSPVSSRSMNGNSVLPVNPYKYDIVSNRERTPRSTSLNLFVSGSDDVVTDSNSESNGVSNKVQVHKSPVVPKLSLNFLNSSAQLSIDPPLTSRRSSRTTPLTTPRVISQSPNSNKPLVPKLSLSFTNNDKSNNNGYNDNINDINSNRPHSGRLSSRSHKSSRSKSRSNSRSPRSARGENSFTKNGEISQISVRNDSSNRCPKSSRGGEHSHRSPRTSRSVHTLVTPRTPRSARGDDHIISITQTTTTTQTVHTAHTSSRRNSRNKGTAVINDMILLSPISSNYKVMDRQILGSTVNIVTETINTANNFESIYPHINLIDHTNNVIRRAPNSITNGRKNDPIKTKFSIEDIPTTPSRSYSNLSIEPLPSPSFDTPRLDGIL